MLRWFLILVMVWWLSRLVTRVWRRLISPRTGVGDAARFRNRDSTEETKITPLTQQEISDADYEEIP